MNCHFNNACPVLYTCSNGICEHEPITKISIQIITSFILIPCLLALSNKIGFSTIWVIYPILITIMAYNFAQSLTYIAPLALAASIICLFLSFKQKQKNQGSNYKLAINFYIVNITIPVLVFGVNIGLILSKIIPFFYISILGLIILSICLYLTSSFLKDIQANQKINKGLFRNMLPQRIRKQNRSNLNLQLALIQQADSQIQPYQHQHQNQIIQRSTQLSPSKKQKIRIQILQSISSGMFPLRQLIVCLLCYIGYQCLCLSMPELIRWFGVRQVAVKLVVGYLIVGVFVIIGQIYLYKFYVEPSKIQQQMTKLNLGAQMNSIQITKICGLALIGGIMQGTIGFGFSYCLFFYLLHSLHKLKTTIVTVGFLNIFISLTFTLSSIFCSQFHWSSYLILFIITLLVVGGFQYLFNSYIDNNTQSNVIQSTLITLLIVVIVICMVSVSVGLGLSWVRFGWDEVGKLGYVDKC